MGEKRLGGEASVGEASVGEVSVGETSAGERPAGEMSGSERLGGVRMGEKRMGGEASVGEAAVREVSVREASGEGASVREALVGEAAVREVSVREASGGGRAMEKRINGGITVGEAEIREKPDVEKVRTENPDRGAVTREELSQLYFLRREIEGQKQRIKELRNTLKSPALSGMPRGGDVSDPVARTVELIEKQEQILIESVEKCVRQQNRLLGFIQSVEDSRMRQILQYRHLDGLNWVQVACRMSVTPESVKMAYKRFFEGIQ